MYILKYYIKKILLFIYNKQHLTKIYSIRASIKANYGMGVLISDMTVVADDVTIGDYSYVNRESSLENCIIGKFCSISSGVYICPFEHNNKMITTHPVVRWGEPVSPRPKVIIGNDVLISLNAIILEGVTIGDGAVIAAGAIVTKDVKPYEIVGGVPAKHIKYRFSDDKIKSLLKLKWWDWDIEVIKKNIDYLRNQNDIME